jgi:hypothetical protein
LRLDLEPAAATGTSPALNGTEQRWHDGTSNWHGGRLRRNYVIADVGIRIQVHSRPVSGT